MIAHENGTLEWYENGMLHREDGPAVIHANGSKDWCLRGRVHRNDGPAAEHEDGSFSWYLDGRNYPYMTWLEKTDCSDEQKVMIRLIYG